MLIHDGLFTWEGFGGRLNLAAGNCRLRIFDLTRDKTQKIAYIKPMVVVVSDLPDEHPRAKKVSVRSCCSHIATKVATEFGIDPARMLFVEFYPQSTYGDQHQHTIAPKYDLVTFTWHDYKALHPRWQSLSQPLKNTIARAIEISERQV